MPAGLETICDPKSVVTSHCIDQRQSEPGRSFFFTSLVKALENALSVERRVAVIGYRKRTILYVDSDAAARRRMDKGIFDQIRHEHRCQRLVHPNRERSGVIHRACDAPRFVYLFAKSDLFANQTGYIDFRTLGELPVVDLRQKQQGSVEPYDAAQRPLHLEQLAHLFFP